MMSSTVMFVMSFMMPACRACHGWQTGRGLGLHHSKRLVLVELTVCGLPRCGQGASRARVASSCSCICSAAHFDCPAVRSHPSQTGSSGPAPLHVSCRVRRCWPVHSSFEGGGTAARNSVELCFINVFTPVQVQQAQVVLASMRLWPRRRHSPS